MNELRQHLEGRRIMAVNCIEEHGQQLVRLTLDDGSTVEFYWNECEGGCTHTTTDGDTLEFGTPVA